MSNEMAFKKRMGYLAITVVTATTLLPYHTRKNKLTEKSIMKKIVPLILLLALSACATSPTGRSQLMLVSPEQAISSSKEAYVQDPPATAGRWKN